MGYIAKSISGSVARALTNFMSGIELKNIFDQVTGTTYHEVFAIRLDLTDVQTMQVYHNLDDAGGGGTPRIKVLWEGSQIYQASTSAATLSSDIDVSGYTGEGDLTVETSSDTAGKTCDITELRFNMRV